jgi:hypothetical protein
MDSIRFLFEHGGSIKHGQLLHMAAIRKLPDRVELLELLLDKGAPIDAIQYEDCPDVYRKEYWKGLGTALHQAAGAGHLDAVTFLLARGADPLIKDSKDDGRLAQDWAKDTLNQIHLRTVQEADIMQDSTRMVKCTPSHQRDYTSEETLLEIVRLLEPSWWSTLIPRRQTTDGKRYLSG